MEPQQERHLVYEEVGDVEEDVVNAQNQTLTIVTILLLPVKHHDASASALMVTMSASDTSGLGMRSFVHIL